MYKLQLITDAKKICPDVVIVLGEDLTRFRDASKQLYALLSSFSWNSRSERLGFDEVWLDVSDLVDNNVATLNTSSLGESFFRLSKDDPTVGFCFDATDYAGHVYPKTPSETQGKHLNLSHPARLHELHACAPGDPQKLELWQECEYMTYGCMLPACITPSPFTSWHYGRCFLTFHVSTLTVRQSSNATTATIADDTLRLRLLLASHLAQYIRQKLEYDLGYTATVGISTNKLLSKLVGNLHKPNSQTTLVPPYTADDDEWDNVTPFIDDHEVGKIPGIGFKIAQKLRVHVLHRPADFDAGLVYGGTKEKVLVRDVRTYPGMGPDVLERILDAPGTPHGTGARVWDLLNGCDDTQVKRAREIPRQISIEDSYIKLDTMDAVIKELRMLSISLLKRIRRDLLEQDVGFSDDPTASTTTTTQRWLGHAKTLRLSTRPRPPQNPDGSRNRSFARISKSAPMPNFVFSLKDNIEALSERLVRETLIQLFRQLHPEKQGWNLSLVNLAATNMVEGASEKGGVGRDIGKMFKRQDDVLAPFRVRNEPGQADVETAAQGQYTEEDSTETEGVEEAQHTHTPRMSLNRFGSEDVPTPSQEDDLIDAWEEDDDMLDADAYHCDECGAVMPLFAMGAHERWHNQK